MDRRLLLPAALLATALLSLLAWRGCAWPPVRNLGARDGPIVILGDSLAAGVGSKGGQRGFVTRLSEKLGVEIVNRGVSGNTTQDGLERLETDVLALQPALVILELGGNDFLRRVDPDQTFANLETMIRRSQEEGAAVLVLGVRGGLLGGSRGDRFRELARRHQAAYVSDILDGVFARPALMADSIHPNDAGHQKIAERLEPVMRRLLREMGPTSPPPAR